MRLASSLTVGSIDIASPDLERQSNRVPGCQFTSTRIKPHRILTQPFSKADRLRRPQRPTS